MYNAHMVRTRRVATSLSLRAILEVCFFYYHLSRLFIFIPLYINIVIIITAGIAVLLTIITYFSTPILTKIFGDGSLEVCEQ